MSIELHILRHGQATHNLPNALLGTDLITKDEAEKKHFDALLTREGEKQARMATPPFDWEHKLTEFWVSPLRRAVQTACLALPRVRNWTVMEDLRERAGQKFCDSRQRKSDLEKWCTETFPEVENWNLSGIDHEEDTLFPKPREDAQRIRHRAYSALCEMLDCAHEKGVRQFVWVSHSCFLSVLLALLNRSPVGDRWLNNGEWRTLNLDMNFIKPVAHQRLFVGVPRPIVIGSTDEFEDVDWYPLVYSQDRCMPSYRNHIRLIKTSLPLKEAAGKLKLRSQCLVVLKYPLSRGEDESVKSVVTSLRGQLEELGQTDLFEVYGTPKSLESCMVGNGHKAEDWQHYKRPADETPPFVEESRGWVVCGLVKEAGGVADASMERMGMICNNECLVVVEEEGEALKNALVVADRLMGVGGANNVTVLLSSE